MPWTLWFWKGGISQAEGMTRHFGKNEAGNGIYRSIINVVKNSKLNYSISKQHEKVGIVGLGFDDGQFCFRAEIVLQQPFGQPSGPEDCPKKRGLADGRRQYSHSGQF